MTTAPEAQIPSIIAQAANEAAAPSDPATLEALVSAEGASVAAESLRRMEKPLVILHSQGKPTDSNS